MQDAQNVINNETEVYSYPERTEPNNAAAVRGEPHGVEKESFTLMQPPVPVIPPQLEAGAAGKGKGSKAKKAGKGKKANFKDAASKQSTKSTRTRTIKSPNKLTY